MAALPTLSGTLYCVAMPIGNPRDITLRALDVLGQVALVACEDTRTAKDALSQLGIQSPRLLSYFEHNEVFRTHQILEVLQSGKDVALISEAGTPTISDPGYRLVKACVDAGVRVAPVPGACAAISALSVSGLPTDRFLFVGFPPKRGAKLQRFVQKWLLAGVTTVFYVPARNLLDLLSTISPLHPDAELVVGREITKGYEEFRRGTPQELTLSFSQDPARGECTVLVRPQPDIRDDTPSDS